MVQWSASAARSARRNACSFITGSEPGRPRHTGHVAEFGGRPNLLRHPQNSLVLVSNWTCTSSPITILYGSAIARLRPQFASGIAGIVAVAGDCGEPYF